MMPARALPAGWLAALAFTFALPARAGETSGTLGASTDYILRGISQSYGEPAWQAGLAWRAEGGFFAGTWASNIDPFPYGNKAVELDAYAGWSVGLGDHWNGRASYTRYEYLGDRRRVSYAYGELSATLGWEDRAALTLSWQPDASGYSTRGYARRATAWAAELSSRWPLAHGFALAGSAGWYGVDRLYGRNYAAGSVGLRYARGHLEAGVDRYAVQAAAYELFDEASADGEWVASIAWRF